MLPGFVASPLNTASRAACSPTFAVETFEVFAGYEIEADFFSETVLLDVWPSVAELPPSETPTPEFAPTAPIGGEGRRGARAAHAPAEVRHHDIPIAAVNRAVIICVPLRPLRAGHGICKPDRPIQIVHRSVEVEVAGNRRHDGHP